MSDKENAVKYELKSVDLPYLSGILLKLLTNLLESPLQKLFIPGLFKNAGITWFLKQHFDEPPTLKPFHPIESIQTQSSQISQEQWPVKPQSDSPGFQFETAFDFAKAYREGITTPTEVANRVIRAIEASNNSEHPLLAVIASKHEDLLNQAEASTQRYKDKQPLSILDGVPVAVKDELDMLPYPTTVGTAFLGKKACTQDATVVSRMRDAGALLIGKTNMHEIGIGVTGVNPTHGTPQNPYAINHYTGGSSSGSAAAVAAGLVPIAIGADGGGSIRIPASFCGVVGLKATFGRISEYGAAPLCWSVAHVGPIGATVSDVALGYAAMVGPDVNDQHSMHQPLPNLEGWNKLDLDGVTLGIYPEWFQHASSEVVAQNELMLKKLKDRGAEIEEIKVPELEAARIAHLVTIASEMAQALDNTYADHHNEHGMDVRINLVLARNFSSLNYIKAQRVRTRMINHMDDIFKKVDIIITPTTAVASQPISPEVLKSGQESDLNLLAEIMRFVTLPNLTGAPAISFPAGFTENGLPIGMQGIGRAWEEALLLRLALNAEQELERKTPILYNTLLS